MVVRSGGVEGKFVQGVYPYFYLVRDVGKNGKPLDTLIVLDRKVKHEGLPIQVANASAGDAIRDVLTFEIRPVSSSTS